MSIFNENIRHTRPNILFVGGGRRVSLGNRFRQHGCNLFAYELDINSPINTVSKIIQGLTWKDPDIKDHLNNVCEQNNIHLVIPLQDEAVGICCSLQTECPASKTAAKVCYDKLEFAHYMGNFKEYPKTLQFSQVILKPRFGCNSKGIRIETYNNGLHEINTNRDIIWQQYIEGSEYSVDCYFNKNSQLIDYLPRKRVAVQGGEVIQSTTINRDSKIYDNIGKFLRNSFNNIVPIGPYCIQFIVDKYENIFIIEANSRFGGGVILSLEAGFDIVKLLLQEYIDGDALQEVMPVWKEDFSMSRYFVETFYDSKNI